jgi:CDP-diacylglycerol---glycerol-3-phosphate 3-phosphatidyltransferase
VTIADVLVSSLMLAFIVVAGLAYTVRVMTRGAVHSDRVTRTGGTFLLGRAVMDCAYWTIDPIVGWLAGARISPDTLTWSALAFGLAAGGALANGWFGIACLLGTCSTFADILDGQLARRLGAGSDRGELLDAAIDRYSEVAYIGGFALFVRDSAWQLAAALAALQGSYMISYATAKAEALAVPVPRGVMRRHERSAYLLFAAGVSGLVGGRGPELAAIVLVAVLGNLSAIQRLVVISRSLRER